MSVQKSSHEDNNQSTRRKAGLGDPPAHFTTNASESMNSVIKSKVNYRKHEVRICLYVHVCGSAHDCGCVVDGSNAMVAS